MRIRKILPVIGPFIVFLLMGASKESLKTATPATSEAIGEMSAAELEQLRALGYVDTVEDGNSTSEISPRGDELKSAPEINPPADLKVFFAPTCSPKAQSLIDKVWTKVMQ